MTVTSIFLPGRAAMAGSSRNPESGGRTGPPTQSEGNDVYVVAVDCCAVVIEGQEEMHQYLAAYLFSGLGSCGIAAALAYAFGVLG
jgi:hypothetical protein